MNSQSSKIRPYTGAAVILLAALVAIAPQFIRGNSCGHDFDVHLASWFDCLHAWQHGIFYPHWAPSPNYGAGEPRFVFYPPLTWMAGAALGAFLPWTLVPIVLTFLILAGTGLATRALALETLEDAPATLAGCVSIFSGFALFNAYERTAFPEFAGGFWLPLLLLFALRARTTAGSTVRGAFDGSTVPLSIALAGAWLSNAPLGVMASYLLAGVALVAALVRKSWAPLLRATAGAVLGLGLAAFYWLPAALERGWVDIRQATQDPGYNFENSWLFAHHADPALALHDVVLRQASFIAVSMIAIAIASLAICWLRRSLPADKTVSVRLWWIPLAAIPFAVFFLLFPISRPVWYLLPEMRFLQYPWRWLEAVEAPMSIFFAAAIWPAGRQARAMVVALCATLFAAATVYAGSAYFQVCYPEDTVPAMYAAYRSGTGFEGLNEYEPPESDAGLIPMGLPDACLVEQPSVPLGAKDDDDNRVWTPEQGSCLATYPMRSVPEHRRIEAILPRSGFLVLCQLQYPAWRIVVNGRRVSDLPHREDGLMAIPVPHGLVNLAIDWTTTPDVDASRCMSGLSVLALTALGFWERRRNRSQLS